MSKNNRSGFTLVQLSVILTIASLVLVASLPGRQSVLKANSVSINKMNFVMDSLHQYLANNSRLPCPSDATKSTGDNNFGVEASKPGTADNCSNGTINANAIDSTNKIAIGGIPFKTLGIPSEYALDGFGRLITYAVDTNATDCWSDIYQSGKITITDNGNIRNSVVALVSHGQNGHGAYLPKIGSGNGGTRLNTGSSDSQKLVNAHIDSNFAATSNLTNFVNKTRTATFDDVVVYQGSSYNINQLPKLSQNNLTISPSAAGYFKTGDSLVFTLAYPKAVTVTGTPSIPIKISNSTGNYGSGNTAYATYTSGSTTNKLTFTYTAAAGDYAPRGITMGSSIDLNGGTIVWTGSTLNACPRTFSAPDLSGNYVNTSLYVAEYGNHTVRKYNLSGGAAVMTIGTAATSGSRDDLLNNPTAVAVDSAFNIWVLDAGNNRVMKFDSAGLWQMTIGGSNSEACSGTRAAANTCANLSSSTCCAPDGSTSCTCSSGSANGQFNFTASDSPSLAFDSGGNLWVADNGNGRIQKFNSTTGAYITKFTATNPNGIAIDANDKIWVIDNTNHVLVGCSLAGSCSNASQTLDSGSTSSYIAVDTNGKIWISDNNAGTIHKDNNIGTFISNLPNVSLNNPKGIALDWEQHIWVANSGANTVSRYIQYFDTVIGGTNSAKTTINVGSSPKGIFIK